MQETFSPDKEQLRLLRPIVGVCVPTGEIMYSRTMFSVWCQAMINGINGVREIPQYVAGLDPAGSRNQMCENAIKYGAEWIQLIDSDMSFPPNSLLRLLAHNVDIVGVDYRRRAHPFQKIGCHHPDMPQGETGLVQREMLGFGMMLMKKEVLEALPKPWFARLYDVDSNGNHTQLTEDIYFAAAVRKLGYKIWCDIDLTREIEHIGAIGVPWDVANDPRLAKDR